MIHKFDPSILREYDIRGLVGKSLKVDDVKATGMAFGTVVRRQGGTQVCVGYDGRHSSPDFAKALTEGLMSVGINVTQVGLVPTGMLYWAVKHLKADAGVVITGSHNPPEYNGIKMLHNGPVYGTAIQELGRIAAAGDYTSGQGTQTNVDISEAYLAMLLGAYKGQKPLKVVWDCGNGATGEILQRLLKKLPGQHTVLFGDIDGNFPNHHPDPTVEKNLVDLKKAVAEHGADLGIGFDGDGDRIGAIDAGGTVVWGDQLLAIYASEVLRDHPGGIIIADVKASQTLFDEVTRLGGKPMMWKTGHSLLKAKMAEVGAPLAGEMSGHIFFADNYGFDDAIYCGLRLLNIVSNSGKTLAQLRSALPTALNTPEVRFEVDEARKFAIVDEVKARLKGLPGIEVNDLDGVRVKTKDGWWLLRASNTQNVLVARAEAPNVESLDRLKHNIAEQLTQSGVAAKEVFG
jgi:phosphomannomutase